MAVVSIIVPIFNCEKYIDDCVSSVINQSYTDWELILVDDGSVDMSGVICDEYALRNDNIKVLHQKNQGVSSARINGLNNATGEFISFLDADDYWDSRFLEIMVEHQHNNNSDVVCCNCYDVGDRRQENIKIREQNDLHGFDDCIEYYFSNYRFPYVIWGKLFRKRIIEGIEFVKMKYTEDTHMMLEVFSKAKDITIVPYDGYFYRIQEQSVMATANLLSLYSDSLDTMHYLCDLCKEEKSRYLKQASDRFAKRLTEAIIVEYKLGDEDNSQFISHYLRNEYIIGGGNLGDRIVRRLYTRKELLFILFKMIYFVKGKS